MVTLPGQREARRASPHHISPDGRDFFALIETYLNSEDLARVRDAFELARLEHANQRRRSGELFFTHPLTVSYYLAEYRLDAAALMAALLHDIAEDTLVSIEQIRSRYGPEVSYLVDGVTNLKEVSAGIARDRQMTPDEIQDASLHKMFNAMTDDVRVVLVKLFDRLHNMRTIQALPVKTQLRKANETLLVYAPLANRLGIWRLKGELEGLSLQVLDAEAYSAVHQALKRQSRRQRDSYRSVIQEIRQHLDANGVEFADVLPSPESEYSVYLALTSIGAPLSSLQTPLRVVILLDDVPTCYLAMGYLHQKWRPVPGTFDDYIALPRENLYRALHTTVIHSTGKPLKVRFRSVEMNEISEIGVLARWLYAGTPMWTRAMAERVQALFTDIKENIHREPQDYRIGIQSVVEDIFRQQVMVYTPQGDIVELPKGATPVDFAYAIHTEVGNHCQTAYINETRYPLNKPLEDGDRVRIVKSGWARPHRTWLDEDLGYLATSKARSQVRRWFRRLSEELAISEGRSLLAYELEMLGMQDYSHQKIADQLEFARPQDLYHRMGRAELLPTTVATRVLERNWHHEPTRNIGQVVSAISGQDFIITNAGSKNLKLCRSCNARPGDAIVGFLRSDGGVTVHKEDCYTLRPDPLADRTIKLAWGRDDSHEVRQVAIQIDVYDRSGLLFEIAELLQNEQVNISSIHTSVPGKEGAVRVILEVEIVSPRQLVRILHRAHALVNVFSVQLFHSI